MRKLCCALALVVAAPAAADPARYVVDPTAGLALPMTPLAGDLDATTASVNPAGSPFLAGWHLAGALTGLTSDTVDDTGGGWGGYYAAPVALPVLPRFGVGLAVEQTDPPRSALDPDPGRPLRLSFSAAYAYSTGLAFGLGWHHFVDTHGGAVDGLNTFDLGLAARVGADLAFGLVARDLFAPVVGGFPLERHWDAEVSFRPFGSDALEIAAGAVVGDRRETVEPRLRVGVRVARGLWLRAAGELRTLIPVDAAGAELDRQLETRVTGGLEVSFGAFGAGTYAMGSTGDTGGRFDGGAGIVRLSNERYQSILPPAEHLERVKISGDPDERALTRILLEFRRIERDDSVHGVFLQLDNVKAGWAALEELRGAIARLRARGKGVWTYIVAGGTRDYYLAAAGNRIYLDAAGGLRLLGLSTSVMFFKDVFDKLGVEAQFEKIAEYKSAPEAFTMDQSSPEAERMHAELLDDVYNRIVTNLARDRARTPDEIRAIFENGPYTAGDAAQAKLVDAVVEPNDLDRLIGEDTHGLIRLEDKPEPDRSETWARPQVAIVYLEGDIVDGKSMEVPIIGERVAGGETISASIAWARENPRVEAIILRVNSPGGSALASDLIAREMFQTRGKKPIVVSIGDVAASGGYFAAAPGDVVFAEPSAVTGSIGIFTGKFDLSALLGRVGITWQTMRRGAHADMESYLRPYSDAERATIKDKLRYFYMRFVGAVSRGRGLAEEEVDSVGRGHVWTGAQAKERRLVDRYGGLLDALGEAKRRAGMREDDIAEIVMLPAEAPSLVSRILGLAGVEASEGGGVPAVARELLRMLPASLLVDPTAVQARLPFVMVE